MVAQYNMLAGGGCSVPEWGLSAIYRCFGRYTQGQVLEASQKLREDKIPVGIIGLEPGWHSRAYSCSYVWDKERYPEPQKLVDGLRELDYHVNLWEHAFVHPESPIYKELVPYSGDYEVWNGCVPDLSMEGAREIFASYHKKLVDMGIDGFKLDECIFGCAKCGCTFFLISICTI